jgi:phage shock protein A
MSVFGRIANLWKGFINLWISDVEKDHPEIAYENAINSMIEKYSALKRATAAIIRRREEVSERLASQQKELAQVKRRSERRHRDQPGRSVGGADPEEKHPGSEHRRAVR